MRNNRAMSVAIFIYRHIYCRYMCPGECIVYDRGEFCNNVMKILNDSFGANIRITSAGRPQGNGQAEAFIGSLKNKIYALMVQDGCHLLPVNWDETLLYTALQIMRSDPSVATGFSPIELVIGRKPKWPIEIEEGDIDFSGTNLIGPLVETLAGIHDHAFGKACRNIKKEQERYSRAYDRKFKTNPTKLRVGNKCQLKKKRTKNAKSHGMPDWIPFRDYQSN